MDSSAKPSPEIIAPPGTVAPRRLAAILVADIKDYSRLMARDEEGTVARVTGQFRDLIAPAVDHHHGQVIKTMGDGFLVVFQSPLDALRCALALQNGLERPSVGQPAGEPLRHRIGINLGDVIVTEDDIYGDSVNVAARLQELAPAGGICISGSVYDQVKSRLACAYRPRGDERLKNIAEPVRAYDVIPGGAVTPIRRIRRGAVLAAGAALAVLAVIGWMNLPHGERAGVGSNISASPSHEGLPDIFTSEARRDVVYQRMAAALASAQGNGWLRVERLAVVAGVTEEEAHDILAEHFPRDVMLRKGLGGKLLAHLAEH
jgi:class 3 adenylate cyclase